MPLLDNTTVDGTPLDGLNPESGKKVRVSCNRCGAKYEVGYKSYICKQREYSRNGETYCRSCSNIVSKGNRKRGPSKKSKPIGVRNANFKGGKFVASDGSVMVLVAVGQYRREDILILEKKLGVPIANKESARVLHIDLDKTNNDPQNVVLLPTPSSVLAAKKSLALISTDLLRRGLVRYDESTGTYLQSENLSALDNPMMQVKRALAKLAGK